MKKLNLIAIIFLVISIILVLIVPESKISYAVLIGGILLLLYSFIKERIKVNQK